MFDEDIHPASDHDVEGGVRYSIRGLVHHVYVLVREDPWRIPGLWFSWGMTTVNYCFYLYFGGADGIRTRDLRRDRPIF